MSNDKKTVRSLIVLGDSIAYGKWDSEGGWVRRLQKREWTRLSENVHGSGAFVFNASIPGETVIGAEARLIEISPRLAQEKSLVLIALGTNDSKKVVTEDANQVSLEKYKKTLKRMVVDIQEQGSDVGFVGLLHVNESLVNTQYPKYIFDNKTLRMYDNVMKTVAVSLGIIYIGFDDILELIPLHGDGIHLVDEGHRVIAERVADTLIENNLI